MTEKSYFWDEPNVGDWQATYSDDELSLINMLMYVYDRTVCSVSHQGYPPESSLKPFTSGANFTLAPGVALVDGRIYYTDATVTLAPGINGFYSIMLRKTEAAQTVRAVLVFGGGAPPVPTQTAAIWEVVVAECQVVAGTPQIDNDLRYPLISTGLSIPARIGRRDIEYVNGVPIINVDAELDWSAAGEHSPSVHSAGFQCGSIAHTPTALTARIRVDFPVKFREDHGARVPLVFVTPVNLSGGTPTHAKVISVQNATSRGFWIYVDLDTNILGFYWVAVCEEAGLA